MPPILGIMDVGQAKTRFFKRDSENADALTLHPHKEDEFWLWVPSWAVFIQKPSRPRLLRRGLRPAAARRALARGAERPPRGRRGEGRAGAAVQECRLGRRRGRAREARQRCPARIAKMTDILAEDPAAHRLIWHDLEAERQAIEAAVPGAVSDLRHAGPRGARAAHHRLQRGRDQGASPPSRSLSGAGCNFQAHCCVGDLPRHRLQVPRLHPGDPPRPALPARRTRCRIDLIYTEAERDVRRELEAKWAQHDRACREHGRDHPRATGSASCRLAVDG